MVLILYLFLNSQLSDVQCAVVTTTIGSVHCVIHTAGQ